MPSWGYIALGIGLGFLLLPLLLWAAWKLFLFVLKNKLGHLLQSLAGAETPPLRVNLQACEQTPEWLSEKRAQSIEKELLGLQFQCCGDYEIPEAGSSTLRTYLSECGNTAAYLCKHPAKPKCFLDLIRVFKDGTTLTVTDAESNGLDSCPTHPSVKLTGQNPRSLIAELKRQSLDRELHILKASDLSALYESGYAELMEWRVEKGGVSREEMLANSDKEMSEEEIEDAMRLFRAQNLEQLQELLRIRYTEQAQMPVVQWEKVRERLLFVHDRLDIDEVRALFEESVYWLEGPFPEPNTGGREGFVQLTHRLPHSTVLETCGQVTGSIPADVYLLPDEPEDW